LREPAVLDDLRLSDAQRMSILQANEALDGPLLSLRNKPPQEQQEQLSTWLAETRDALRSTLDSRQLQRLEQIRLRIRGYRSLLDTPVADRLGLSATQHEELQQVLNRLAQDLSELQERLHDGEQRTAITAQAAELQQAAQTKVFALLSPEQRQAFLAMAGRPFDVRQLARVRFKAPEFSTTDQWINSPPLKMADLRGQVVAVHFFAYG
jgi:hypothetical protein